MSDLTISLIQGPLFWEDKTKNMEMFSEKISSIQDNSDLIILPEMFSTGFTMNAASMAERMDGKTVEWMSKEAKNKNCIITGSIIIEENGSYFNRLIWMRPDGYEFYNKRHLFSLAGENNSYTAGRKKFIVNLNGWRIQPLICYDLRFPIWSRRTKKHDYDLLIYTANWPERRIQAWSQLLIARAIENQCYVAGVNRTGTDGNNIPYTGQSALIDFKGDALLPPESTDNIRTFSISKTQLDDFRRQFAFLNDSDDFEIRID
jgi:predicted amidohydrolase